MNFCAIAMALIDNGGRRSGFDRRQFSYTTHIPERRNRRERRLLLERRGIADRRCNGDRRSPENSQELLKNIADLEECRREKRERRNCAERRMALAAIAARAN